MLRRFSSACQQTAAGGEDSGIDGGKVVVFRVARGEHEHKEDDIGPAKKAPLPATAADQQPRYSRQPEKHAERAHHEHLRAEELQRREDGVLVIHLAVVNELERGKVVVDLPEEIWKREDDDERHADERATCEDDAALGRKQQADEQRDEEDHHRRLVLDADAAGDAEDDPPVSMMPPRSSIRMARTAVIQKTASKEFMERKLSSPRNSGASRMPSMASACATRLPPIAQAISPVRKTAAAPASAVNMRMPASDLPKSAMPSRACSATIGPWST